MYDFGQPDIILGNGQCANGCFWYCHSAEDGEPLIGASVMIKGTKVGTTTDFDGNFSITTQVSNPQIVVSFIGMETATLKGGRNMKVVLNPDKAQQIGEVIVTGMQKMDKRLFTGAATRLMPKKQNWMVSLTSLVRSKAAQPVSVCRTCQVLSVLHRRFVCVVPPLSMVRLSHFGWLMV